MIIKKIASDTRRRGAATADYLRNAADAEPGEVFGPKAQDAAHGSLNCFADDWQQAAAEIATAEQSYEGEGNPVSHWVIAWGRDERPTPAQEKEAWETFLRHQGMEDHALVFVGHSNTDNYHSHALVCRLRPEADADGKLRIRHDGGTETRLGSDGKRRNHEINNGHRAVAEICKLQGWDTSANIFNPDGSRRAAVDSDKIRLGQKVEAAEARTGEPSGLRQMAEKGVEALRQAKSWDEARDLLGKAGIKLRITDSPMDVNGKVRWGGYLKDHDGHKVKLSALPRDCGYKALDRRFSGRTDGQTETPAPKALTANSAKYHARSIFNASTSLAEAEKALVGKGMSIERQGKTGGYLRFGEGDEGRIKLSALGGKYSLSALNKKYNVQVSNDGSTMHNSQGKVNGFSRQDALKARAEAAGARASSAEGRAAEVAAEGSLANSIAEAIDDALAQAMAMDAVRKAKQQAAQAAQRAREMEERATKAEKALKQHKNKKEGTIMTEKQTHIGNAARDTAVQAENLAYARDRANAMRDLAILLDDIARLKDTIRDGQWHDYAELPAKIAISDEQRLADTYSARPPAYADMAKIALECEQTAHAVGQPDADHVTLMGKLDNLQQALSQSVSALPERKDWREMSTDERRTVRAAIAAEPDPGPEDPGMIDAAFGPVQAPAPAEPEAPKGNWLTRKLAAAREKGASIVSGAGPVAGTAQATGQTTQQAQRQGMRQ